MVQGLTPFFFFFFSPRLHRRRSGPLINLQPSLPLPSGILLRIQRQSKGLYPLLLFLKFFFYYSGKDRKFPRYLLPSLPRDIRQPIHLFLLRSGDLRRPDPHPIFNFGTPTCLHSTRVIVGSSERRRCDVLV